MELVAPEMVGFSSSRLRRIDAVMQAYVDQHKLAGLIAMVARRGQVAHLARFGLMDIEAGKPMQFDTLFRIYSMTKPITSVAVMMLYEEGRFRLSDPVSRFIPGFKDMKVLVGKSEAGLELVDPRREIAIVDLLTHTAGLSYGFDEKDPVDALYRERFWGVGGQEPDMTLEETVREITTLPLAHQPGTTFRYSMATDVLGYLVQVISGMPFDAFLKERIFDPLGMVDTDFWVPPAKIERFAATYGPAEGGGLKLIDAPATSRYARPTHCPSGGGGLVSTAADYNRFAQMLLNRGKLDGVRLLGRKTVELMTVNHLPDGVHPSENTGQGFGLGGSVVTDLARYQTLGSVGTFAWSGAASTEFWVDPQEQVIGLLMVQLMPHGHYPVDWEFKTLTYQALVD